MQLAPWYKYQKRTNNEPNILSSRSTTIMPAITPNSNGKVLVSGANGYIAMWVVRTLLERGYSVRGTVRRAEKGKHLYETFKSYGDKLEVVVVEDITKVNRALLRVPCSD